MGKYSDPKGYIRDSKTNKCTGQRAYKDGHVRQCDHPSHGCFPSDTLVSTEFGMKKISQISKGDRVWTKPSSSMSLQLCTVKRVQCFDVGEIVKIRFASGRALRVTKSHSLLSGHGWTAVRKLRSGQAILRSDHRGSCFDQILEITKCEYEPVYNLVVDKNFTFLVQGGYVAHSFSVARAPRVLMGAMISRIESRRGFDTMLALFQWGLSFVAER